MTPAIDILEPKKAFLPIGDFKSSDYWVLIKKIEQKFEEIKI